MDTSEKNFEEAIERALLSGGPDAYPEQDGVVREPLVSYGEPALGGYHKRTSEQYDKALCLIPDDVLGFVYASQPKEWDRFKAQHAGDARERLLQRLAHEVRTRGTLDVLRKGIKANGCRFALAYFRPASGLNEELQRLYEANLFAVVRQLHYGDKDAKKSLDLVIFLNGLPIFTAELKNPFTGQTVEDAIRQYRHDRDPREPLFAFGRCLAHFAVDPDLVYMTTHLQGAATRFLPFNQGRDGGAGNPPSWKGFATAYLWERIWARDSVLDLVQNFIQVVEEENDRGQRTGTRALIFPRYHQLDAVRRLVAEARSVGTGHRYLVQHSAGSGKSNTIAWLAHRLSVLHDDADRRVFDSIVVISDRRILNQQLQRTVRQFEQTPGVVENIDKTSRQLKDALEDGKTIIVTTLQMFPVIVDQIGDLPGQRFAVIVDEAHSSQSGESATSLKKVLAARSLEEAEREDAETGEDQEDRIAATVRQRGQLPNVSMFAFTATPKPKTLELFGTRRPDGSYAAFSLYTMRQAIEEGFILDVLQNYVTYKAYWNLLKTIEDDPHYDRAKAAALLTAFVNEHQATIARKVEIMVEHFADAVVGRIGGKAKAMIVTRSRLHAVRYKQQVDDALRKAGYPYKALVAFSGTVRDGGVDYTEAGMNRVPETQTARAFERDEYRLLIVANKFQTGFDQPLLHTMYVDKKLGGVHAVQTLSRLNRVYPGKEETMVLDFANEAEEIQGAFAPYYDTTLLSEATDPNLLYDIQTRLEAFDLYTAVDVERFAALYFDPATTADKLHAALDAVVRRFEEADEDTRVDARGQITDYVRLYAFLSQIIPFVDTDLEKLYVFARFLLRKLRVTRDRLPVEIQENIAIESYHVQKTSNGKIALPRGTTEMAPIGPKESYVPQPEQLEALSEIIQTLNRHFGTSFSDDDKLCIRELEERLAANSSLEASIRANTRENARLTFDHVANDLLQDMVDGHFRFYKQVTDDPEFAKTFLDILFDRYVESAQRVDTALSYVAPDDELARSMDRAVRVLQEAGVTSEEILDELPAVRDEVMREMYGAEFMDELGRRHAALRHEESSQSHGA